MTAVIAPHANGAGKATLVAAARRLPTDPIPAEAMRAQRKVRAKEWQQEAWACFDAVGQIKQGYGQLADAASKCRLFVGWRPLRDGPVESAEGQPGYTEATDALARLDEFSTHGLPGVMHELVINFEVPGECYLTGENWRPDDESAGISPIVDAGEEHWEVRSVDELSARESTTADGVVMVYNVKDSEDGKARALAGADPYVARLWRPHPRWSNEPDSPMRAVLEDCDELLLLKKGVRAILRGRVSAGFWPLPNNLQVLSPSAKSDEQGPEAIAEMIMQVLMAPVSDEGDPAALVPALMLVDPEVLDKIREPINFQRLLGKELLEERDKTIRRILDSLNFPSETVTGMGASNHWSAWLIDDNLFARHIEPDVQLACHGITTGFLRPLIEAMGVDAADARRLVVWYDPDPLITRPNVVDDTFKAAALGAVGFAKIRSVIGAAKEDAATPEDLAIMRSMKGSPAAAPAGQEGPPADGDVPTEPTAITAAASRRRKPLGQRLLTIDRDLRARLEAAATAAMGRALERAGNRVRSRAEGDPAARDAISASAARDVTATLGPAIVAALGVDDGTLLDGAFDDLAEQYDRWTAQAQGRSLSLAAGELDLDADEENAIAGRQNEDRSESWAWLSAALFALASARLYDPHPAAPGLGEHDPSLSVPTGVIREAMARAGGAQGPLIGDRPAGGVATGGTLLDLFALHGRVVDGWEWVWGSSSVGFEPHENLDGVAFETWTDEVLAVPAGYEWLGVAFLKPGDHQGCGCDFLPVVAEAAQAEAA